MAKNCSKTACKALCCTIDHMCDRKMIYKIGGHSISLSKNITSVVVNTGPSHLTYLKEQLEDIRARMDNLASNLDSHLLQGNISHLEGNTPIAFIAAFKANKFVNQIAKNKEVQNIAKSAADAVVRRINSTAQQQQYSQQPHQPQTQYTQPQYAQPQYIQQPQQPQQQQYAPMTHQQPQYAPMTQQPQYAPMNQQPQ